MDKECVRYSSYNIAYDVIEYDYTNDMIIRRYEKESNVDVKCSKASMTFLSMIMDLLTTLYRFSNLAMHLMLHHIKVK